EKFQPKGNYQPAGDYPLTSSVFGIGQKWYSVRNERQTGVTYRNNTKKAIVVSYFVYSGKSAYAIVDGVNVVTARAGQNGEAYTDISATFIVPPDSDYSITGDVVSWSELR
ncbi:phage tail protein, partial [Morganella morganii]